MNRLALLFISIASLLRAQDRIEFNRDIRPILSDTCFLCHGPDKAHRKADLRLDVESSAKAKREDHFTILPGKLDQSELIRLITTDDADERMPPPDSGRQLTKQQIDLLKRWVAQGAPWQAHWSFIAPQRPALPPVNDSAWPRNAVDHFILAKLENEGLAPSPEADAAALQRRVTLDLTGLPPAPSETSEPYTAMVDRLLASPRFGERMAIRWLDAARYADTSGYQSDGERWMWRWRDWVIDAFNANMPFDQFTIEQIGGDLLPRATLSQKIATAFNRNHRGNAEGGIVPEEFAVEYVVDRVDTTCTVWMGLTMGCARCHDHKYDPLTQRDFYSLFAFFNNVPEKGKAIKVGNSVPWIPAPTTAQQLELTQLNDRITQAEANLAKLEPVIAAAQSAWEKTLVEDATSPWTVTRSLQKRFDKTEDFDGRRFVDGGDVGDFGYFDKFSFTAWIKPRAGKDGAILSRMVEDQSDSAFASIDEGYRVFLKDGHVQLHLTKRWLDDALRVETEEQVPPDQWRHITVIYDGSRVAAGVKIFINGQSQKLRVQLDQLNQTFATKQPFRIGAGSGAANRYQGQIRDVRVYTRALTDEESMILAAAESVTDIAKQPVSKRTDQQAMKMRACFLAEHAEPAQRVANSELITLREQRAAFVESIPTLMVMEEMPVPREAHILKRGVYDQPGELVFPGVPASLPPMPADAKANRLGFAQWLVSEKNPLTARVAVNQLWQMLFGTGLVKTSEDFGSQGESPSHPDLLDWLATEFMRDWDVKRLIKLLVTSATYRQSSRITPAALSRDPENRLLSHAPRFRLSAEMVRDQALAAAGLLVENIGGPSVKPYQPSGLGKELSGTDLELDHGDKLFRRGLYTFWKRTSPQPTMTAFDAPGREMSCVRPSRTDTPLQALALMNDITFVEAARALAQRVMGEVQTREDQVCHAFRLVLNRSPKAQELKVLLADYDQQLTRFLSDPSSARALITTGESPRDNRLDPAEHAALAALCGLILNLDEAVTKQ
jgi:hypothetical protein